MTIIIDFAMNLYKMRTMKEGAKQEAQAETDGDADLYAAEEAVRQLRRVQLALQKLETEFKERHNGASHLSSKASAARSRQDVEELKTGVCTHAALFGKTKFAASDLPGAVESVTATTTRYFLKVSAEERRIFSAWMHRVLHAP
ncbi:MAG: hypothetical protein WCG83_01070 [Candidatus Peregrinibacteria bacterium]